MALSLSKPAAVYFLSARTKSGDLLTVSREGDEYVFRGGFFEHRLCVAETNPRRLDLHFAGYISGTESEMNETRIDWTHI